MQKRNSKQIFVEYSMDIHISIATLFTQTANGAAYPLFSMGLETGRRGKEWHVKCIHYGRRACVLLGLFFPDMEGAQCDTLRLLNSKKKPRIGPPAETQAFIGLYSCATGAVSGTGKTH